MQTQQRYYTPEEYLILEEAFENLKQRMQKLPFPLLIWK